MLSCLALLQLSILNLENQIFSSCCTIPPIPLYLGQLKRRREAKKRDEEGKREVLEAGEMNEKALDRSSKFGFSAHLFQRHPY